MISLEPIALRDIKKAMRCNAEKDLFKWVPEINGCLLKLKKIKPKDTNCHINDEIPRLYIHTMLKGSFFCPKIGDLLVGTIVDINESQLFLTVFDLFTAVLPAEDINNKIFQPMGDGWMSKITKKCIKQEQNIQFRIKRLLVEIDMNFTISGEIIEEGVHGEYDMISPQKKFSPSLLDKLQTKISDYYGEFNVE